MCCLPNLQLPLVSFLFSSLLSSQLVGVPPFRFHYGTGRDRMGQHTQRHDMRVYGTREQQGYLGNDQVYVLLAFFFFICTSSLLELPLFYIHEPRRHRCKKEFQPTSHDNDHHHLYPWARQLVDEKRSINIHQVNIVINIVIMIIEARAAAAAKYPHVSSIPK
ncbi:hypothetical protein BDP67DRAFT_266466 [Colletotrichum lupini]|nr:hypothetical protein BDP67DRAFT_266466 [Colletotrichum lupini]